MSKFAHRHPVAYSLLGTGVENIRTNERGVGKIKPVGRSNLVSLATLRQLQTKLQHCDVQADLPDRTRLIVTSANRWPAGGNTFNVFSADGIWYVGTFLPCVYRVPTDVSIIKLCCECLEQRWQKAWYRVPTELITKHRLEELNDSEHDILLDRLHCLSKAHPPLITLAFLESDLRTITGQYSWELIIAATFIRVAKNSLRSLALTIFENTWHVRLHSGRIYEVFGEGNELGGLCLYWIMDETGDEFSEDFCDGYGLREVNESSRVESINQHAGEWKNNDELPS